MSLVLHLLLPPLLPHFFLNEKQQNLWWSRREYTPANLHVLSLVGVPGSYKQRARIAVDAAVAFVEKPAQKQQQQQQSQFKNKFEGPM